MRQMLPDLPKTTSTKDLENECQRLRWRVTAQAQALQRAFIEAEDFDYSIAHNLRAPLRAVAATASILLEENASTLSQDHRMLLERQVLNASQFGALIDDLLAYSRVGRAEIRRREVDVTQLACRLSSGVDAQHGMQVVADPELTAIALGSLIDNARKFSSGGPVRVRQKSGVIAVSDDGVGFESCYAERIFKPFERLVAEEYSGNGIGLAKVRRIAERHGGAHGPRASLEKGLPSSSP